MISPTTAPIGLFVSHAPIRAPKTFPYQIIAILEPLSGRGHNALHVTSRDNGRTMKRALPPSPPLMESNLRTLKRLHQGKVRDIYDVDGAHMLIVTTDRLSAFDVVLPDPIPGKGRVLTELANFWFHRTTHIVPNQLTDYPLEKTVPNTDELALIHDRAIVVKRLKALPIEAVVRGYLIGSGWKDYQKSGAVCGIALPKGLKQADRLSAPIFTPATKAALGEHDENISFEQTEKTLGAALAEEVRDTAISLYRYAADYALQRGIIIADTK